MGCLAIPFDPAAAIAPFTHFVPAATVCMTAMFITSHIPIFEPSAEQTSAPGVEQGEEPGGGRSVEPVFVIVFGAEEPAKGEEALTATRGKSPVLGEEVHVGESPIG